jgi:hypothetical protein
MPKLSMAIVLPSKRKKFFVICCGNCSKEIGFRRNEVVPGVETDWFKEEGGVVLCPGCKRDIALPSDFEETLTVLKLKRTSKGGKQNANFNT